MSSPPTIAVIGSGAVGLYYGGRLAQHHCPVHFLLRSDFTSLSSAGLHVRSCDGDFHLPPTSFHPHQSISTMPPADIVLVALKTTSNHLLPALIPPLLKPNTTLITLQNGLGNEDALVPLVGAERILGGIAFTCINRLPDSSVHHSAQGLIRLGAFNQTNPNLHPIAYLFSQSNIRCQAIPDLMRARWQKLIWNVPFNGLGASLDLDTAQILASPTLLDRTTRLMREIMAAAAALGHPFPDPDGMIQNQLAQTSTMDAYRTSMQLDRHHRRPLEHDAIIGEPLRRGTAAGVPMPETARLFDAIQTINSSFKST